jgi:hypothetical protein
MNSPGAVRRLDRGWKGLLLAISLAFSVSIAAGGTAWGQMASHARQGAGISITLKKSFIDEYADRATIVTDFIVDRALSHPHPAKADGELHIGGRAIQAQLATVAELTNPAAASVNFFKNLDQPGLSDDDRTVKLEGAWRIWCEHAGTTDQSQADPPTQRFTTSNPDHVFEIHPITKFNGTSLLKTFHAINGYEAKDADRAFRAYENIACRIRVQGQLVTITSKSVGDNFAEFVFEPDDKGIFAAADGKFSIGQIHSLDGELIARRRRVAFVNGTPPEIKLASLAPGKRMHVIGIPRINLALIKYRVEHATADLNAPENPLNWDLPYEMIIVAAFDDAGPIGEDDDEN